MPMHQNDYEKKLKGLVKFIKTNEPQCNPSEKQSRSDNGMVVVTRVLPQGPCSDCGKKCRKQRFCMHRRDRNSVWHSHCQECGLYRNAETGRYEPKPVSPMAMKRKAQIEKARLLCESKEKTSERTTHLLQRLAEISRPPVPPTNDHSDD